MRPLPQWTVCPETLDTRAIIVLVTILLIFCFLLINELCFGSKVEKFLAAHKLAKEGIKVSAGTRS